jgi:hypothetical protein
MKLYRTIRDGFEGEEYSGDRAQAHGAAKTQQPRAAVRVELVDVPTDKAGVLALLNEDATARSAFQVERTWALNVRGGLREVPNGE